MSRVISLSLVTLFLFVSALTVYGYPGKHHRRHDKGQWWDNTEDLEQLNLTDQQKGQIEAIASDNKERLEGLYTQLRTGYKELKEKMENPNSTREEILSEYDKLRSIRGELGKVRVEMMLDIREVLSPEQITALADMKEQHREHCRKDK